MNKNKAKIMEMLYENRAELIAEAGTKKCENDSPAWKEEIYLRPDGTFYFQRLESDMTKPHGEDALVVESVKMTAAEALAWCRTHGAQEAIDTHFSDMIEEA